jgi:hypothetical protein
MGFTPPINQWIVDTLKEEIDDIVNSKYCLNISMDGHSLNFPRIRRCSPSFGDFMFFLTLSIL